jgi:hypothetical protein
MAVKLPRHAEGQQPQGRVNTENELLRYSRNDVAHNLLRLALLEGRESATWNPGHGELASPWFSLRTSALPSAISRSPKNGRCCEVADVTREEVSPQLELSTYQRKKGAEFRDQTWWAAALGQCGR